MLQAACKTPRETARNDVEEASPLSSKAFAVACLSAIAIAACGCSGDSDPGAQFRAAFKEKFEAQPWHRHVTGMDVVDGHLEIATDLEAEESKTSRAICGAASNLALDRGELGDVFDGVQMMDSDGVEMGGCG